MIAKVNLQQTLDRWLAFIECRLEDGILADISHPVSPPRSRVSSTAEPPAIRGCLALEDPEGCLAREREKVTRLRDSLSDAIPTAYPTFHFGESVWAGLLGAQITFAGTDRHTWSACRERPVKDLNAFDFAPLDVDNPWFKRMLGVTRHFADNMEAACDVTPFIFLDCLNLLVELRGADGYTDIYDYPEIVSRFMDWSVEVNMHLYDAQAEILGDFADRAYGRHPAGRYSWSRVPSLSVDAYGLCNPDVYERWGLEQHQRIVSRYGGARLHIHGNGRRLCKLVSRNEGLTFCSMGDDAGCTEAWKIVGELKERMSPVPIGVAIPRDDFLKRLHDRTLPGGVLYKLSADSSGEANDIMSRVFEYSPR